ncbi:hypothetical protein [Pseudarthrobacter sp. NIBRBAC000502771]|uniref:hypothetical protein n=1 Tax=Pseudarthrobacter sp. NIBRBAC000502771 TaxID=2590774 RepID=UPI001131C937|nr:hypothetical protein [Pseudarthrobacter sp. NIBRBAC000502771]QDG60985.1 hypothetical protein NIBR502771_00740 [Pseudarthrobacter sp. NIBRBAC000502771]
MIETLQWTTLAVCAFVAAARIPSTLRGENRSLFGIFAMMTLAILLSIQGPYLVIDQALGGINLANLLLRFVIFAAIYFTGIRISRGFGAKDAYRLITGRTGMAVLAVISAVAVTLFFLMDTSGSSAGLTGVVGTDPWNSALLEYYGAAGRAYPAFVALALLPAMVRAVSSRLPALIRAAAALLALGAVATGLTLSFPLIPPALGHIEFIINYTAVLCFVVGLALIWAARVVNGRSAARQKTSTET